MSRELHASTRTAAAAPVLHWAVLAELQFDGGTIRLWTGIGDKVWNSKTFAGAGDLAGIDAIGESTELGAQGYRLSLSGVPSATISLVLSEPCVGRPVWLWLALMDSAGAIIGDPVPWGGRMDTMSIVDAGETCTVTITCESRLVDLFRSREARYTHEEQQRLFSGDLGLQYVATIGDRPIYWGVKTPAVAPPPYTPPDDIPWLDPQPQ